MRRARRRALAGEDVGEFAMGKRFNPFWFEHGAMKAARNARFRLIPAGIKAQVIAMAKQQARVKEVETGAPADADGVSTDVADQLDDEATNAPLGLTLDEANALAFPWKQHKKYGGKPLFDVSTSTVYRALWWAEDSRAVRGASCVGSARRVH